MRHRRSFPFPFTANYFKFPFQTLWSIIDTLLGKNKQYGGIVVKLRVCVAVLAVAVCIPILSSEGRAQTAPLIGKVTSASTASSGARATVYTTPTTANGSFILTQFCASPGGTVLNGGAGAFFIAIVPLSGSPSCVSLTPGYAVPASTALTCLGPSSSTPFTCSISGVTESALQAGGGGLVSGALGLLK